MSSVGRDKLVLGQHTSWCWGSTLLHRPCFSQQEPGLMACVEARLPLTWSPSGLQPRALPARCSGLLVFGWSEELRERLCPSMGLPQVHQKQYKTWT